MKTATPSPESYAHAAWMLDCDTAAIMAVAEIEAGEYGAWIEQDADPAGPVQVPMILFEPHRFHELTGGRYDARYPDLSYPRWNPKGYGKISEQHARLDRAIKLDRDAAMKATSWGLFQIMGANYRRAGFDSVQAMVNAAYSDADAHLRMFVWFIASMPALQAALRQHDWRTFARLYNGAGFEQHDYDGRIAVAYARLTKG